MSNIDRHWGSWAQAPDPVPESEILNTLSCDVAVLGAGISGVACALRAAQNGLDVVVLEKTGSWSGRGGNIGVVNSKFMRAQGIVNDLDEVAREWIKRCANLCDERILWQFLRHGEEAMDWLLDIVTAPEYGARPELQACLYRGETYNEIYGSHRFFDGPMHKKGMRAGGADCVYAMYCEAVKKGVRFVFNSPAQQLIKEDGRVKGAIAKDEQGYFKVMAKRGVVIATGDIGGNREMCDDLAPLANRCVAQVYAPRGANTGDGHRMGLWAGGMFEDTPFPVMSHPMGYHFVYYCFLFVDPNTGERFMNEDNNVQSTVNSQLRLYMPYAWSLLDGDWLENVEDSMQYGGGMFWEIDHGPQEGPFSEEKHLAMMERGLKNGHVIKADTIEELGEKMGVPMEAFLATVKRYNSLVEKGHDDDFGKRKELLKGISKPPFYAIKFGTSALAVTGGLRVDPGLGVQDENLKRIPGLFAVGNAMGGRYGVNYPMLMPGNSHGTALTFGYLLGNLLADEPPVE